MHDPLYPLNAMFDQMFRQPDNAQPDDGQPLTEPVEKTIYIYDDWMTTDELRFSKPTAVRRIRWDGERIVDVTGEGA